MVLNQKLKSNISNYEEPNFPFKQEALIRDYNSLYLKIYDKVKYVDM